MTTWSSPAFVSGESAGSSSSIVSPMISSGIEPERVLARGVRVLEAHLVALDAPDPERGLHVLDDLALRPQLLDELAPCLELGGVAHDGADELRHQAGGLDRELVEGVGSPRHHREDAFDAALAVERRADQGAGAEADAGVRVDARSVVVSGE